MAAEIASRLQSPDVALHVPHSAHHSAARIWSSLWPKLGAVLRTMVIWQLVVWSGWKPESSLPGPWSVLKRLAVDLHHPNFYVAIAVTLRRAAFGYAIAAVAGFAVAMLIARINLLRRAVGSLLVGLQSMPSIAWFPLAVLLLEKSEGAITIVVLMGAAPAIAAGLLTGMVQVYPRLVPVGRAIGAEGLSPYCA